MNDAATISLVLIDADDARRRTLRAALAAAPDVHVLVDAASVAALSGDTPLACDFLLLSLGRPGAPALTALKVAAARRPAGRLMVVADDMDDDLLRLALSTGASAVLLSQRPPERIVQAMRDGLEGHFTMDEDIIRRLIVDRDGVRMAEGPDAITRDAQEMADETQKNDD